MGDQMHLSLDEAREELAKRWNNIELKKTIKAELGDKFMPAFADGPRGATFRQICSPDNGFSFFYQCAKYVGAEPLILEYHDDIFTHINEEKKGLGRLRLTLEGGEKAMVDVMNFHENEKKKMGECVLKTGEKLVDFHHKLFEVFGCPVEFLENSKWFHLIGRASEYYYPLLLHFVAHGFLSETLVEGDEKQLDFSDHIMMPAILEIRKKYGLTPIFVKSYPDNQNDQEDFYWWSYPPAVNAYLIEYAKNQHLPFKKVNLG
jgi:hypothetical protein